MLHLKNISHYYGALQVFDDLSIGFLGTTDRMGIVGGNGVGKTTLLKIVGGIITPDFGEVCYTIEKPLIGYMPQEFKSEYLENKLTVKNYLEEVSGVKEIGKKIEEMYDEMGNQSPDKKVLEYVGELQEKYEKLGGYDDSYIDIFLGGLELHSISKSSQINSLSGGQKSKILLIGALISGFDMLLLDEPTNNLDTKSKAWLIEYLNSQSKTMFIISHDVDFLDTITNKTLELSQSNAQLFSGNYSFYRKEKALLVSRENEKYLRYSEKLKYLEDKLKSLGSQRSSTLKVKRSKENDRLIANKARERAQNSSGNERKNIKKEIEELQKNNPDFSVVNKRLSFDFDISNDVYGGIEIFNADFRYPDNNFGIHIHNFSIKDGERVLLLGENGGGKSTFIKIINGELLLQNGKCKTSPSVILGNYSQEHENLDYNTTLFDFLLNVSEKNKISEVNHMLAKFYFDSDERHKKISSLSPGQRSRLLLISFILNRCNTLIFDEPTNHLDLEGVEELIIALKNFSGNLLVVSHDTHFIEQLEFDYIYKVDGGIVKKI
ncbi:ATP-binding cassette domain-containing protein [Candidatus Gracilibacteria bacterium]|nr:ATP-binding cassette domain-containing protein [Candidatus Gracilibacteria bacterium]